MLNKTNINSGKQKLIVYLLLILATLAVYWQVSQFEFINIDDNIYVTENPGIKSGITPAGLKWAFTTTYAEFWHPLTWLSLMFDHRLHGLNAGGYHLTNLILHILSTLLLFWLFNRMTGALWPSAFVAAFFALHPLHVESVAWIADRKDVLSAFFWMLTLCLYVYYVEKPDIKRYLLVFCGFVLALMSKPMVVTLPVIMILLDYWPLKRFESQKDNLFLWQLKEKLSFFILSAAFIIITFIAQQKPYDPSASFPLASRLANAPVSFVTYLVKTLWPHDLAVLYPFSAQIPAWQVLIASLLIIVITAFVIITAKRLPYLLFGWLWFVIIIAPVIGIIQVGNQVMADRYTYLPLIGIGVGLAWGIPALLESKSIRKKILFPAGIGFLVILSFFCWKQCGYWRNSIEICNHVLQITKNNYVAHIDLGTALFEKGKTEEAIAHYNDAIRIRPNLILSYNKRGVAYAKLGRYQQAFEDLNMIINLKPDYAEAYHNRGAIYAKMGRYQQAFNDLSEAIRLKPNDADAYYNRGTIYKILGRYQQAIDDLSETIRLKPEHTSAYFNRGGAYINLGQYQLAINDLSKAISLAPTSIDAYNNRGFIYLMLGRYQEAFEDYSKAILLKPDYANAWNNRAFVYLKQGNNISGCSDARKACELGICATLEAAVNSGLCR